MLRCPWCDKEFELENSIVRHSSRVHKKNRVDYDLLVKHGGAAPSCKCGCGTPVAYSQRGNRFNDYVAGHQHQTPEIRNVMIQKGRETAADPEKRRKMSEGMKRSWRDPETKARFLSSLERSAEERYAKIKRSQSTIEYRQNLSKIKKEQWQLKGDFFRTVMRSDKFRRSVSEKTRIGLADPNVRKRLSQHASDLQESGAIHPHKTQRTWITDPVTNKDVLLHSGWELQFYEGAIANNVKIQRDHGVRFEYIDENGLSRSYTPDFLLPDLKTVVEIKGYSTKRDELKHSAANLECERTGMRFVVLDSVALIAGYFKTLIKA